MYIPSISLFLKYPFIRDDELKVFCHYILRNLETEKERRTGQSLSGDTVYTRSRFHRRDSLSVEDIAGFLSPGSIAARSLCTRSEIDGR